MASATAERKSAPSFADLYAVLGDGQHHLLADVLAAVPEPVVASALAAHAAEVGHTKYVTTGNPALADLTHNGVSQAKPCVIIEDGIDWPLPTARLTRHDPPAKIAAEKLPTAATYQKYQLEVCVSKERDVWEWLEKGQQANGREVRYARRDITRAEAEALYGVFIRLTDKGLAAGL